MRYLIAPFTACNKKLPFDFLGHAVSANWCARLSQDSLMKKRID
ncbi:hypothetical protein SZ54_2089 [Rhizobium sp. UR51a]|nr:hypothetical protein SZ54_2089 [Rhizobium sp. UR51a]